MRRQRSQERRIDRPLPGYIITLIIFTFLVGFWRSYPIIVALAAVVSGRADIVRILLAAGADPSVRAKNGDTPLDIATKLRSCFPAVYDALMDHKEGTGCVPIGSSSTSRS